MTSGVLFEGGSALALAPEQKHVQRVGRLTVEELEGLALHLLRAGRPSVHHRGAVDRQRNVVLLFQQEAQGSSSCDVPLDLSRAARLRRAEERSDDELELSNDESSVDFKTETTSAVGLRP